MKNLISTLKISLLTMVVLAFVSCSKTKSPYDVIPAGAKIVFVFDGNSLSGKLGVESFSNTKTYDLIKGSVTEDEKEDFEMYKPIFENSEESGLDFKKKFFFFMYKNKTSVDDVFAFYIPVLNKEKFTGTVNKIRKSEKIENQIKTEGDISYFMEDDDSPFMAWNDKSLVFLMSKSDMETTKYLDEAKKLLNNSSGNSIMSNKDFAKFASRTKDLSLWMDYGMIYDVMPPMQKMMIQTQLPFDMTGTMIHFYTDFQDGKIVSDYDVVMNDEMKKLMAENKIMKDKFDTGILSVLSGNPLMNISFAFDFSAYYNLMKSMMEQNQNNFDNFDEQFKAQTGMTVEEALDEFSGEVSISLHGIDVKDVESIDYLAYYQAGGEGNIDNFKKTVKKPVFYYSAAVKFNSDKLFNLALKSLGDDVKELDNYYSLGTYGYFGYYNGNLLYTNDSVLITDVAADGKVDDNPLSDTDIADKLKDYPAYVVINLDWDSYPESLRKFVEDESKDENEKNIALINMLKIYKKFEIMPESESKAKMVLWLKDDSRNSLEVIFSSFDDNIEAFID
jgi:hypothetical protein